MARNEKAALVLEALKERVGKGHLEDMTEICAGTYLCQLRGGEVLMARVSSGGRVDLHQMESST